MGADETSIKSALQPEKAEECNATTRGRRLASPIGLEAAPSPHGGGIGEEIAESRRWGKLLMKFTMGNY